MASLPRDGRSRPVAAWLFAVALMVFAMVVVGGATRLTGSGLSITQWKPVAGALPPMSDGAWREDFSRYQATPQYRLVNRGMSLGEFKFIFWWEWAHRLLGRLVGVVFGLPFLAFLALRRLPRRLIWRCVVLLGLGGLQGAVGWWMVVSGLEARVLVAPERLATHLGLALILLAALIWTGLEAWFGRGRPATRPAWALPASVFAGLVFLQCLLGALVAGNQAGLIDSDWPLMNGAWFPAGYAQGSLWMTLAHSQAAVQFNHRILAYGLFVGGLGLGVMALRARAAAAALRALGFAAAAAVAAQASLGVATLMAGVPLLLAILHQAGAAVLLCVSVCLLWRARRA